MASLLSLCNQNVVAACEVVRASFSNSTEDLINYVYYTLWKQTRQHWHAISVAWLQYNT